MNYVLNNGQLLLHGSRLANLQSPSNTVPGAQNEGSEVC